MSYNVSFVNRVGVAPGTTSFVVGPTNFSGTLGDAWVEPPSIYPVGPDPVYPYITPPPGFPGAPSVSNAFSIPSAPPAVSAPTPTVFHRPTNWLAPYRAPTIAPNVPLRRRFESFMNPYATESTLRDFRVAGLGAESPFSFFASGLPGLPSLFGSKPMWFLGGLILGYLLGK